MFWVVSLLSPLNHPRSRAHFIIGRLRGRTLKSTEIFSFKSFTWLMAPSMLENRGSHAAVSLNESIYVIGGGGLKSNLATCEVFDYHSQSWSHLEATMATCMYYHIESI